MKKKENIDLTQLEVIERSQEFFDAFNTFMISSDIKVFGKLLARALLYDQVKSIPGDIIECGVFKGTGLFTFLKLKSYYNPHTIKKVLGFDYFDSDALLQSLNGIDKEAMSVLFGAREFRHKEDYDKLLHKKVIECGFKEHEFDLIKGNISETMPKYFGTRPGMKVSLLYIDVDLGEPTYDILCACWDKMSKGGIVVFDEYAHHQWSESLGADKFFKNKDVTIKTLDYYGPTAYVVKK